MAEFQVKLSAVELDRVRGAPVGRLATVRPDGSPHLVPITFAFDADALVSAVDAKPKRTTDLQRLRNVDAHPVASLLVDSYDDDWTNLWWIRIDGSVEIVLDGPAHASAIDALVEKYAQYRDQSPVGAVIRIRPTRVATWEWKG